MRKFFILLVILVLNFSVAYSQKSTSSPNFKQKHEEAMSKMYSHQYSQAIAILKNLLTKYPEEYDLYTEIGECYMHTTTRYEAISYLNKAAEHYRANGMKKKSKAVNALYLLGKAYYVSYEFEQARKCFEELKPYSTRAQKKNLESQIESCKYAEAQLLNPLSFYVIELNTINSIYADYCPAVTSDQSKIFFTSKRYGTGGEKDPEGDYYEDIYCSERKGGVFLPPINLGDKINSNNHEATASVSPDGKELFIYKTNIKNRGYGDIFYSILKNNEWSKPEKLPKPINTKKSETHAFLSSDGKTLFFTSSRRKGEGKLDIYTAERQSDGSWGNVKNLGDVINTPGNEEGPALSPDNNTLYFSSDGRTGMGGYDIYKSEKQADGSWSEPQNMGFPLNTVDDDVYFVPTLDPTTAYYSSKQSTGVSSIYMIKLDGNKNIMYIKGYVVDSETDTYKILKRKADSVKIAFDTWYPERKALTYSGSNILHMTNIENNKLVDKVCRLPQNGVIEVYNITKNKMVRTDAPVPHKGNYGIELSPVNKYLLHYTAPGYIYDVHNLEAKPGLYKYDAELDSIIYGQVKSEKHSEFVDGSNDLSDYQKREFTILSDFMKEHPLLYVDVTAFDDGHTNDIINFLLDNGVNPEQIYKNLSPNHIANNTVEYTIYDSIQLEKVKPDDYVAPSVSRTAAILVRDLNFVINKYNNTEYNKDLDIIANYLKDNPQASINLTGYTDTQGNSNYNKQLSIKRANHARNYLINKGVLPNQVSADGKGFEKQISVNKDNRGNYIWESLGYNRRTEIEVVHQGNDLQLFVEPVQVPEKYKLDNNPVFSVNVIISEKQLNTSEFSFDIIELLDIDNKYNYIHGQFATKDEAQTFVDKVKSDYPEAFIFINNYRK